MDLKDRVIIKRLLRLVRPHWKRLALAMLCMAGVGLSTAASAYLIKPVLDDIFVNKRSDMLRILPFAVLALLSVKGLCVWGNQYLMSYVGQHITATLRQQVYNHIQNLSVSFFDKTPTGKMMARILNDVGAIQAAATHSATGMLKEISGIIGLTVVIFYRDWKLALIAVVVLPIAFIPLVKFGRKLRQMSRRSQESVGNLSVLLHETISGNRIVKAFGMEDYEKRRFEEANRKNLKFALGMVSVSALTSPVMEFFGGLAIVGVIWYGGASVIRGESTPGNFFSFLAGVLMLYDPVKRLTHANNTLQQGIVSANRIFRVLDTPAEIQDCPGAVELPAIRSNIEFRDVNFSYGRKQVLHNINLSVNAGEIVALVGVSGSGKTTLVNLIPRFYDVTSGAILIDDIDIRGSTLASLRSQIALVTQQSILFNDTIRNNIAYGSISKGEEEITAAARAANAYEFIMQKPKGFDTVIGEGGIRISGGERQRICIARALLKNAPILILDEATSSLDSESELEVQRALENLMSGRTTFVIAHRLSTIKNADRIIAIADGRIVEQGRHDELLRMGTEYRRLYELQFSQFDQSEPPAVVVAHRR